jgi:uncharacterized protein
VGKTTLARQLTSGAKAEWFDLEDPASARRLESPRLALEHLADQLVVIDKVQRAPEIFPILRVLVDEQPHRRFLLLGSAAPQLVRQSSESLAGRIEFIELGGLGLLDVGEKQQRALWSRGAFPRSFLASNDEDSFAWRENFIRTFLERDLPLLHLGVPPQIMRQFWTMIAHYHGQTWKASEFARALGISSVVVTRYLEMLSGTFVVRTLPPWFENISKRQVKSRKVYVRDTGLLHGLLGLRDVRALEGHPKVGASWEGFAIEQIATTYPGDFYFWGTQAGAELDLLQLRSEQRWGFEFKRADAPDLTRSMHVALETLRLDHLWVVYPGEKKIRLHDRVTALSLQDALRLA